MTYADTKSIKLMIGDDFFVENEIDSNQTDAVIADASAQVDIDEVPTVYKERASRLYACHLLTMIAQSRNSSVDGVSSEKVGALQTTYAHYSGDERYGDRYEREYNQLLERLGLGGNVGRFI
ncbi:MULTISPECIES: DUF4054 domain-containing protein [Fructobacillus]|uniref:DUF4054 domain-containing protein n=1 Tax=Fructobacillus tropaeoli TaxID=709323 RepID=A0ABM9MNU9_9LACO|nr:DUF4054 domain-containing protein [Fructobacillus tropaeoli]QHJ83580.1 MAG: hypothetical protein [Caudoviricetes sp.]CAK1230455.1 unnamed protein product [Fructobacillus cardui]CAK1228455.1 unnamed protein product [Fructobacillus tropaeoli]CAK1234999.1 unnamed protein product [Fructobacillus tropaeoli]GIC70612.1 hypothetical protein FT12353_12880 [Fructobacillus tropaeoli]